MAAAVIAAVIVVGVALGWPLLREEAPPAPESPAIQAARVCAEAELDWKNIEASNYSIAYPYENHLSRFPDCSFAGMARQKLEVIRECEAFRAQAWRLYEDAAREDREGFKATGALSSVPGQYWPNSPIACAHMELAIRYSDELKRLAERKQATCNDPFQTVLTYDPTTARNHVRQFCRGPAPATTPAPPKGKSKETRPRSNAK